jgi:hypothetical protein
LSSKLLFNYYFGFYLTQMFWFFSSVIQFYVIFILFYFFDKSFISNYVLFH